MFSFILYFNNITVSIVLCKYFFSCKVEGGFMAETFDLRPLYHSNRTPYLLQRYNGDCHHPIWVAAPCESRMREHV